MKPAAAFTVLVTLACVPKQYYVLSPDTDYSDDPSLAVRLIDVEEVGGDSRIILDIENKRADPIALSVATVQVYDFEDTSYAPVEPPSGNVEPGATDRIELLFATKQAPGQTFEVRFAELPVKVWPIVYSKEKPPDFKATPDPTQGQQPPGRPPSGPY